MATETWQIDNDDVAVDYAMDIIRQHYPLLVGTEILWFRISKASWRTRTQTANAILNAATGAELVITVNDEAWDELDTHQRQAQMHWALAHIEAEEDEDTGDVKIKLQKPIIQDFPEVVAKWGSWQPEITEYVRACNDGGATLTAAATSDEDEA